MPGEWDVVATDQKPGVAPGADPWAVAKQGPKELGTGEMALGLGETVGRAIGNIPSKAANAVVDLYRRITGGDTNAPKLVPEIPPGEAEKHTMAAIGNTPAFRAIGGARDAVLNKLESVSPTARDVVRQTLGVAGDVGDVAGAAGAANIVKNKVADIAATRAAQPAVQTAEAAGMSVPQQHPIAAAIAGESGQQAQTIANQTVGNTIAANEAGHAHDVPMTYESMAQARAPASQVYNRVARALPAGPLDSQAINEINSAGQPEGGRITTGSPQAQTQIGALRTQLGSPRAFTGDQVVNELRGLRQEGFKNAASEDVSNQELGKAQLDMARAIEGHIERNLPTEGADVTIDQFRTARQAIAKNYAVEGALRGSNVDLGALARAQRADPGLLTDGLKALADFANENPTVSGLGSKIYTPPSWTGDILNKGSESVLNPGKWAGIFGARAAARRVLTGAPSSAIESANRMFPPRAPGELAPIPAPPRPRISGLLPAPTMVNAGGGAVPAGSLADELGLSQDVQAAGRAHPGAARPAPPQGGVEAPAPRAAPPVDFQSAPPNWGLSASDVRPAAPGARQSGIPLADLLSHGVEPGAARGLTLAEELGAGGQLGRGLPFTQHAGHLAGDLGLAPEDAWFRGPHENVSDLPGVASQGVPEGIMTRTQQPVRGTVQSVDFPSGVEHPVRVNNGSGESAASVEAINRPQRNLVRLTPDGQAEPIMRGVEQADTRTARGRPVIDADTGEIINRGGLTKSQAEGLRNRWASTNRKVPLGEALTAE